MANAALTDILGSAVIDGDLRFALLRNPGSILADFDLTLDEREAILSIRATTFEDFAAQLYAWMVGQGNGYGSIHGHDKPPLSSFRPVAGYTIAGVMAN